MNMDKLDKINDAIVNFPLARNNTRRVVKGTGRTASGVPLLTSKECIYDDRDMIYERLLLLEEGLFPLQNSYVISQAVSCQLKNNSMSRTNCKETHVNVSRNSTRQFIENEKFKNEITRLNNIILVQENKIKSQKQLAENLHKDLEKEKNTSIKLNNTLCTYKRHVEFLKSDFLTLFSNVKDTYKNICSEATLTCNQIYSHTNKNLESICKAYNDELKKRIYYSEKCFELEGRIRVYCRLRPPSVNEKTCIEFIGSNKIIANNKERKEYTFDKIFPYTTSQLDIFDSGIKTMVNSVVDGYNGCIFAYGQTGSGKTYTMTGNIKCENSVGIIPRVLNELFLNINTKAIVNEMVIKMSVVEIYNDTINDLLADNAGDIDIRTVVDPVSGNENVLLINASQFNIKNISESLFLLNKGFRKRSTGSTSMNQHSSRSHLLTFVYVYSAVYPTSNEYDVSYILKSKLCLVDLAGSERINKSEVSGNSLKETQFINKSLSTLGDVINALQNHKTKHIPYRNSKLTFALKDVLGNGSKALLMLQINPCIDNLNETICSLNFGSRASKTCLGKMKKKSAESKEYIALKEEIGRLTEVTSVKGKELKNALSYIETLKTNLSELESMRKQYEVVNNENTRLRSQISSLNEIKYQEEKNFSFIKERERLLKERENLLKEKERQLLCKPKNDQVQLLDNIASEKSNIDECEFSLKQRAQIRSSISSTISSSTSDDDDKQYIEEIVNYDAVPQQSDINKRGSKKHVRNLKTLNSQDRNQMKVIKLGMPMKKKVVGNSKQSRWR